MEKISLLCLVMIAASVCTGQWVKTAAPDGGVTCFAVIGTDLFAGYYTSGAYRSTDNGTTWTPANAGLPYALACLTPSGTDLYAGTGSGAFRSTDRGSTWQSVSAGLPNGQLYTLVVKGPDLFAGMETGGVFHSTDNGASWTQTSLQVPYVLALAVSGEFLFAGTNQHGVFRSSDNGTTWMGINEGKPNWRVNGFAFIGPYTFVGHDSYPFGSGGGVYVSADNGTTWAPANVGLDHTIVYGLAVCGQNLFAATYRGGVYLSTNNGASWTAVNSGLLCQTVHALAISGRDIFAGGWEFAPHRGVWGRLLSEILPPGTVIGTASVNGSGLANVTVTLLDENGNSLSDFPPTKTNSAGQYTFTNVPSGLPYQVIVVEPLGYAVDQNPKSFTLPAGGTATADFALTPEVICNRARGVGYWKHQFDEHRCRRHNWEETEAQLYAYIAAVHQYYDPHFDIFGDLHTFDDWESIMRLRCRPMMLDRAKKQLAALVMNFVSLKIGQYTVVTRDNRTAGDVLTYVSLLVVDGNPDNDELARNLAFCVNNRIKIAQGLIPEGGILYKAAGGSIAWGFNSPTEFALAQNYPNPFNPTTTIRYQIPAATHVTLRVYDVAGRQVADLVNGNKEVGSHEVVFDASYLASGVYIYRLVAGNESHARKMMLIR